MNDIEQEVSNEKSYAELLVGNKKGKDPRWHAVIGLGHSINILSGIKTRAINGLEAGEPVNHVLEFCEIEIPRLWTKKERLKKEIHEDEKKWEKS